ncbi:endolytic transglycosylase MltG [Streptomyces sp. TRM 70361]|uniref:endolytic transglycosylase MltG n=1 Tax=Streptomyces sp. TRM 70361 TaxID=3116553 RepID=UPI002E7BA1CD|nr:endolytic transglycosylase MltG [Streptomyces sp. TRM 70361]MEE1939040.1 endolytic transglycosylase MltG [Streptomyces sp. TRM 70361]
MTEYGRGSGSEPWDPDDPLYGDRGWKRTQTGDWDTHGEQQYGDPYGQQQGHQQQYGDPYGQQQGHQQQYGDPYGQQQGHQQQYGDPYGQQQGHQQQYGDPYGQQQGHQQQYGDPYGQQQGHQQQYGDPYGQQQGHQQQYGDSYGDGQYADRPDPQQPRHEQHGEQGQEPEPPRSRGRERPAPAPEPDEETGWDPGPDQGEHAFFADDDTDDDDHGADGRSARERRGKGGTKRRNGFACLVVATVLIGGVGAGGYFAYDFYQTRFAPAPDFSGSGSGEVQVEIPEGSSLAEMGAILEKAGVIKSQAAFIEESNANAKSKSIQAGVYTLRKEMSAEAAMAMMLDPATQNTLIIAEGKRASDIYRLIDEKLGLEEGATAEAAENTDLGLPEWAEGNPEGFLFPARYTLGEQTKPGDLLKKMVARAEKEFAEIDLEAQAAQLDKTPYEILTIASLIQAEAQEDEEFGKVSRVIYNRLDKEMLLQFDSTINYAKGESKLDITVGETRLDHPYNTYVNKGLPPGPIDNPGHQALEAALDPTEGNWLFFVTVKPGDTRFTDSQAEHDRNVRDFNAERNKD